MYFYFNFIIHFNHFTSELTEPEFSVIRSHFLGNLATKLRELNRDEVESVLDFDKLLEDTGDCDREPLVIKAAKDSVAHRCQFFLFVKEYILGK